PGREGHATHASSPTHPGPSLNARDDIGWLRNLLQANPTTLHAFANVPNARVQHDVAATRILTTEDAPSTVGELHALLDTNNAVDPEDLWQLADDLGMSADITWPGFSTDGSFDVVFRPNGDRTPIPPRTASAPVRPWHEYANDPSAKISIRKLAPELRTFVAEHLPDYMVPAQFVVLESLPLTAAGKVDRRALPPPDHTRADLDDSFAMPRTAIEATLASIWAEVLDVDRVGIKDNFFELGGDSILSIQIIARANEAGLRFTPKQLFQHQTIAELAAVAGSAAITPMEQGEVTGNVPLTPIQQWFFDVNLPHAQAFTQSAMFDLDETADRALAERILAELQNAHDAFRLRYVRESDGWRQFYTESAGRIPLTEVDLSKLPEHEHEQAIEATAQELQQGLNLASGPIARAALFHPGPGQQRHLLLFAHHLVVDGVSWRILQRDVQTLLEQLRQSNDQPVQLPLRTTSFKHWAERLREFAQSDEAKHALDFWSPLLDTEIPALPLDHHDDEGPTSAGVVLVTLSADETRNVLQEVPKAYRTQINDVLLTALAQAFCEWSGESKLLLDMEGHGREPIFDDIDLSRTVGWFTSVYPVLLDLTGSIGPGEALRTVKEQLRRVPGRGMSFGVLKYLSDDPSIVARMHDLPNAQICFNYLGQANAVRMAADPAASPSVELTEVSITDQTGEGEWGAASHLLDINGAVNNGRLQLSWAFSTKFHRAETIKAVAEKFASALRLLIAHCKSSEARGYSPSDFPLARLDQDKLAWLAGTDRQIEDIYPLSPMQEGMLFHSLYDPDSGEYIEQALFPLPGNLDIALFRKAWDQLAERHSILRTSFVWSGLDSPLQIVRRKVELPWEVRDASIEEMQRYLDADGTRGFDLSRAPLMRFAIFRISDDEIQFLWTSHHILLDGWSHPKVLAELHALYDALVDGSDPQLEPVRPYRHYIEWLEQQDLSKAEVFWRETLKGFTTPTPLVIAGPTVEAEKDYFEQYLELSAEKSAAIERVARESAVTANTVAQAGWALLLSRYSGENDVLFGAVVAGRPTALTGVERMVGLFINTLPVRVRINPAGTVSLWLKDLQRQQIDAREFEHTPLSQVQGWSDVRRGSSLFDSLFVFENYPDIPSFTSDDDAPETEGVPSEPTVPMERTNYLLTVAVVPGSRWILRLTYESTRIPHDAIRRLLGHYRTILTSIARQPEQPTRSIPLLSASERHELLHAWNATERTEPPLVLAHQAFEQQAALTPRAIAVDFDPEHLTYAELNSKANQLAREILTSETLRLCDSATRIVAIALERSIDSAIALLATLKAGCAYVPLDPTYPADRLAFMLEDSGASLLLTHRNLTGPTGSQPVIYLDDRTTQLPSHNLDLTIDADSPAYVIYTSGSTGKPKGIVMPHGPLANLIRWQTTTSTPRPKPRTLQFAPLSFDVHFQEMFATWAAGGTVVLITEQLRRDTPALVAHLCERRVDRLFLPFVALQQLAEAVDGTLPPLREVITAGEQLQCTPSITSLFERLKKASLHNHYGPSESHVVTAHRLDGRPRDWPALPPIGKPIDNARIHILDDRGHPVPVGVPGHLHIGGDVLAHGYRNLPDVTAERFISDPFVEDETARLYATGDLARYLPDGAIEFLGRSDFQVKIRGFRIEPGEIEVILSQHPAVQHCVVTSWEDAPGDKRLVGYIVPHHQPGPGAADLRKFLETRLPEYMLPSAFVTLASLPMTASGKVDRKALPAPDRLRPVLERPFEAPRDPVEERLAAIYADVLHVDRIGIHDNFFELGGHSLLATRILSRIRDVFQVQLSLRTVFETPTVAAIAAQVVKAGSASLRERKIPRRREAGTCPLSFAQQRLWFLDQLQPNTSLYNVSRTFPFAGTVDPRNLESALNGIVRRHEVLRTTFVAVAGRPFQLIAAMLQIPLPTHDLRRMRAAKRDEERARITAKVVDTPFDLSRGPLLRAALIRLSATESELVVAMHHIITDGWSMDVFARELLHPISSLDELPVQYADYAVWQRQWVDDDVSAVELAYWRKQLAGIPDTLDLPYDRPRPAAQSLDGAMLSFAFPKALSDAVRETARAKNVTPFTMLLAAFTALLSRLSNSTDIVIGTPVAGRSRTELENLIGLFVNTVVLRTNLDGNPTMDELLRRVEQTTLEAFDHQDLPFDRLVAELAPNRQLSYNPVVQVMFAVQSGTLQSDMLDTTSAKFDLICTMYESDEGLSGAFEFSTDLLDSETARRWATLYERTLTALVSEGTLSDFPLLTDSERDRALITWNDTASDYPHDATLIGLFAEQVAARPDHPAVIYGTRTLTYRELDALSTHLASTLDINPGDRIAIQMDRSPDLIASLIAILKRGATYVPLDTTYPQERIRHILEDSHAKIWSAVAAATAFPQRQPQLPHVPAYLMYTSGSTGNPKGVAIPQRAIIRLVRNTNYIDITPADRIAQSSSIAFDAATFEIWGALLNGATIVGFDRDTTLSATLYARALHDANVTTLFITTALFNQIAHEHPAAFAPIRNVLFGGEKADVHSVRAVLNAGKPQHLMNVYGPTETTTFATFHEITTLDENETSIPIGRAIGNTQVYILDRNLAPQPIGIPGEIYIGGDGLALEYLNAPDLTAARFVIP
ncbi:MAG TPA: amino acid adenylation domain-containing protein, partial [Thermoanaerobaculia bacterium]|nr:amino acid adenylation domain-containing protein [Thermoanaerobaculia bacterium]